jgi:hypothetical protein
MIEGIKTTQDMFNHVARHLFRQHDVAIITNKEGNRECRYRDDHSRKCAVGSLIDDAIYSPNIEGTPVSDLGFVISASIGFMPTDEDLAILRRLQGIHDSQKVEAWPEGLASLAKEHGLEFPFTENDWKECLV